MTHCKCCIIKEVRNVDKIQKVPNEHTNKDCHLKKVCCCYAHEYSKNRKKDLSPQRKRCETCCVIANCKQHEKDARFDSYDKSVEKTGKYPTKEKSPEKIICQICCCLLKNCCCKEKCPGKLSRPRTLTKDLPLYDEKSHLLGYIKKGAVIDHPSCIKSRDYRLDSEAAQELGKDDADIRCMSSCRYAEGIRRQSKGTDVPRWTSKSAFQYATKTDHQASSNKSKKKSCPC